MQCQHGIEPARPPGIAPGLAGLASPAMSKPAIRTSAVAALMAAAAVAPGAADAHRPPLPAVSPQVALDWNQTAVTTLAASGKPQTESMIYMGLTQAAVYDAVVSIQGGFEPYLIHPGVPPGASPEAAAATAAHGVLSAYFPTQKPALDAALAAALAAVPDGASEARGTLVGRQVAAGIVAARVEDGRDAPFDPEPTFLSAGVWRRTPPAFAQAQTPWVAKMTPLLLRSTSQFQPGPPPALTSRRYARDFEETRLYGAKNSAVRTPAETETALFYTDSVVGMNNRALRSVIARRRLDLTGAARALAMGDMVIADADAACLQAKYAYWFWRPVTAIPLAGADGNPATVADPAWVPLRDTPNHPEYPGAHGCNTAALGAVVADLLGTDRIELDLASNVTATIHHLATVADLEHEIVNARTWIGFHFRHSSETGVRLGERVAHWALDRYFQSKGSFR
jgi:hypothetical protein